MNPIQNQMQNSSLQLSLSAITHSNRWDFTFYIQFFLKASNTRFKLVPASRAGREIFVQFCVFLCLLLRQDTQIPWGSGTIQKTSKYDIWCFLSICARIWKLILKMHDCNYKRGPLLYKRQGDIPFLFKFHFPVSQLASLIIMGSLQIVYSDDRIVITIPFSP